MLWLKKVWEMESKTKYIIIFTVGIITVFALFFVTNPSYQKSLEAKFYYKTGVYDLAYTLSREAFELDNYNKMAATIMTQSQLAMDYEKYIEEGKKYLNDIKNMLKQTSLSDANRTKIKLMAEIMVGKYKKLTPSVAIDKNLQQEAKKLYQNFRKILEKVNR